MMSKMCDEAVLVDTLKRDRVDGAWGHTANDRVIMRNVASRYVGLCYSGKQITGKRVSEFCRNTSKLSSEQTR